MRGAQKNVAIQTVSELQRVGFEVKWPTRNTVRPHAASSTALHWHVKCAICRLISEQNDVFFTEVDSSRGLPDILHVHIEDERVYCYEVETGVTKEKEKQKASQYTDGFSCSVIADVKCIDPLEAPDSIVDLYGFVEGVVW